MTFRDLVVVAATVCIIISAAACKRHDHDEYDPDNPLSLTCRPRDSFLQALPAPEKTPAPEPHLQKRKNLSVISSTKQNESSAEHNDSSSIPKHASAIGPCRLDDVKKMYNFAAFSAGAQVLASSSGMKGAEKTLITDSDKYMSTPCSVQSKWFVIQLSEDVEVSAISVTNLEHYSSGVEYFQLLGSDKHPTPEWILMGYFRAENSMNEQIFCLDRKVPVRYLKIRLLSHYGNEQYCTLNSFKVYGSRLLEALGRALDETLQESRKHLDQMARAGSDLKGTAAAFLPNKPDKDDAQALPPQPSPDSQDRPESPSQNSEIQKAEGNGGEQSEKKPTGEKISLPHGAAPSSGGPQNIITKLTNRIKDLEINQTMANHAVERLSQSLTATVEKLESAILSMDAVLVARDKSIQSLLASAVQTTNTSTIAVLSLRAQLAVLNAAYEEAESTLRTLRFALAIALITICAGIVGALFKTSSGPIYQHGLFHSRLAETTPAPHRRRRRIRSGRLSKVRSMDLTEVSHSFAKNADDDDDGNIAFRPAVFLPSAADDSGIAFSPAPCRLIRQNSHPFLSNNKFQALIDENESTNDSD